MKKLKIILISFLMILLSSSIYAGDKWDKTEKVMMGATVLTQIIDCGQTIYIFDSPNHYEKNNLLKWTNEQVDDMGTPIYFAGYALTTYLVADLLPSGWRKVFLSGMIVYEADLIYKNYKIGIKFKF